MGGLAFGHYNPPLATPRMPPEIYTQILTTTINLLRKQFLVVRSAIEAPGKETYGDIDIFVFYPKPRSPLHGVTCRSQEAILLGNIIGAEHYIIEKGGHTICFAIPWPQYGEGDEQRFVQADIKICPNLDMLAWELFHTAHGDLWNILGSVIRKFGLTINDKGMFLRIAEIEARDRKKSMVFLTDNPGKILRFLRLDEEKWWKEFSSRKEMFEYAAGCRMFWVKDLEEEAENGSEESPEIAAGSLEGQEGGDEGKRKLKHNDRQRMKKRPIFREWMDVFIPMCRAEGRFKDSKNVTREQIRGEAFAQFDPDVKATYESRIRQWKLETHTANLWRSVLKGTVPEDIDPQFRAASIQTLKAVIMEGETFKGKEVPEVARNAEGFWDVAKVRTWVEGNWKKAGDVGWERQQEKAREGMRIKAEKKRLQEEAANKRAEVGTVPAI